MQLLGVLILMLQVLLGMQHSQKHPGWTVMAPSTVRAEEGSCVVVPCSYDFSKTFRTIKTYRGLWKKVSNGQTVAASRRTYYIHPDYKGRTHFVGPVWRKNCTWLLENVRATDAGLYFFRVELPEYRSFSWKYQPTRIEVVRAQAPRLELTASEVSTKGEVTRHVLATCSLVHACPLHQPSFIWSHNGTKQSGVQLLDDGQRWAYSTLTFNSSEEDFFRPLKCTVQYYGGRQGSTSVGIVKRLKN